MFEDRPGEDNEGVGGIDIHVMSPFLRGSLPHLSITGVSGVKVSTLDYEASVSLMIGRSWVRASWPPARYVQAGCARPV